MEPSAKKLWHKWQEQVKLILPSIHGHRTKALALLVFGIVLSGSAVLQRIAESFRLYGVSEAKMSSIERRLARFVANESVVVTEIWNQFLEQVLAYWRERHLLFVLDCTSCGQYATIIYLGLLVHSRVLPVAWCVMPGQIQWTQSQWELVAALLDRVRPYVGQAECSLIADRGLAGFPLVQICQQRHLRGGHGAYLSSLDPPWWDSLATLEPDGFQAGSTLVWASPNLARSDYPNSHERYLGARL